MDSTKDIEALIKSRYPLVFLNTYEEKRAEGMLASIAGGLGMQFFTWSATEGLRAFGRPEPIYNTVQPLQALGHIDLANMDAVFLLKDFHPYLDKPTVTRKLRELAQKFHGSLRTIVISAPKTHIPEELEKAAVHLELALPSERELRSLLYHTYRSLSRTGQVSTGATREVVDEMVANLKGLTLGEAERIITKAILDDGRLSKDDLKHVFEAKKEIIQREGVVDFFSSEESLKDLGGFENLKRWLKKRKGALSAEAAEFGLQPPKGMLLLGVPGCGKSLCAKAVASDWALPLLKFEPARIYDKYVGESEKNLRKITQLVDSIAPCVLWIDEIEKGFSMSGSSEADAGLSKRIFGAFISWLQEKRSLSFVVATCNDISQLPPELLRKGRFDEIFFVDLPQPAHRAEIFSIHIQRRNRDPGRFDLPTLADASEGFSGAEIEGAIVSALYSAFAEKTHLTTERILEEIRATSPLSVVMAEKIDELRQWASGRTVPA